MWKSAILCAVLTFITTVKGRGLINATGTRFVDLDGEYRIYRERKTWDAALKFCTKCYGGFATFPEPKDANKVKDLIYKISHFSKDYDDGKVDQEFGLDRRYWFGLNDIEKQDDWKWFKKDGEAGTAAENIKSYRWYPNQPDHKVHGSETEHCAGFWNPVFHLDKVKGSGKSEGRGETHYFNDFPCSHTHYFICKKEGATPPGGDEECTKYTDGEKPTESEAAPPPPPAGETKSAAPSGTTAAPSGTTAAPSGTTAAPSGTTAAASATTAAPGDASTPKAAGRSMGRSMVKSSENITRNGTRKGRVMGAARGTPVIIPAVHRVQGREFISESSTTNTTQKASTSISNQTTPVSQVTVASTSGTTTTPTTAMLTTQAPTSQLETSVTVTTTPSSTSIIPSIFKGRSFGRAFKSSATANEESMTATPTPESSTTNPSSIASYFESTTSASSTAPLENAKATDKSLSLIEDILQNLIENTTVSPTKKPFMGRSFGLVRKPSETEILEGTTTTDLATSNQQPVVTSTMRSTTDSAQRTTGTKKPSAAKPSRRGGKLLRKETNAIDDSGSGSSSSSSSESSSYERKSSKAKASLKAKPQNKAKAQSKPSPAAPSKGSIKVKFKVKPMTTTKRPARKATLTTTLQPVTLTTKPTKTKRRIFVQKENIDVRREINPDDILDLPDEFLNEVGV